MAESQKLSVLPLLQFDQIPVSVVYRLFFAIGVGHRLAKSNVSGSTQLREIAEEVQTPLNGTIIFEPIPTLT